MRYRRIYIGRPLYPEGDKNYELGCKKKDFGRYGFDEAFLAGFCADEFEAVTGIKLEPGEVRKVRIHVELLD